MNCFGHRDHERAARLVSQGVIRQTTACTDKFAYPDRNQARAGAKSVARKTGRKADIYKCPGGPHYHVTKLRHGEDE